MKTNISELEARLQSEIRHCTELLVETAASKKATDVIAVRVGDKTILADWFIFMSGTSAIHVKSLCDEIEDRAAEAGLQLRRREGYNDGRWIVLDYASIIVHIFHPEEREYYNVERLWMDETTEVLRPEGAAEA
ncbi:MAG: ribosome silencing factor [Clostridia bacterium]|nr:ribosome silencing factor [Clostridia bacterium]